MWRSKLRVAAVLTGAIFLISVCTGVALAAKQDDIWGMLKKDHDQVKKIIKQLKDGKNGNQFNLLQQMLAVHMQFEEQNLYPTLQKNEATRALAIQAQDEHKSAKQVLDKMAKSQGDKAQWTANLNQLDQLLNTHIKNEERKLFKEGKRVINKDQARQLGAQYAQMKAQGAGGQQPKPMVEPQRGEQSGQGGGMQQQQPAQQGQQSR